MVWLNILLINLSQRYLDSQRWHLIVELNICDGIDDLMLAYLTTYMYIASYIHTVNASHWAIKHIESIL